MRTYAISFNGNAPERWTHEAVVSDHSSEYPTFAPFEFESLATLNRVGQSMRLHDGTRATLVEA